MTDEEIGRIEQEMMTLGRHASLGAIGDCARQPVAGRLERSAYILMSRIEASGPLSIGQLADAFGLDTSTINRQTAAMLRAGLVERIPDPDGGLARKFRITPEGLTRLHHHRLGSAQREYRSPRRKPPARLGRANRSLLHQPR